MATQPVIVVGAGPSGLLLVVVPAKKGITVQLLEAASQLDDRPRATHYALPATYEELRRAGILEKMEARGALIPDGVCWRKLNGEYIARIDAPGSNGPSEENLLICLSLDKLCAILKEEIDQVPNVEILLGHTVTNIGQDETKAWVDVRTESANDSASLVGSNKSCAGLGAMGFGMASNTRQKMPSTVHGHLLFFASLLFFL
ncbi:hypothetical protein ZTR_06577 [Talaromyces verruculosus]|nr:hypothetical protein ZTR_06577 [Talaromyces verruculosus]